MSYRRGGGVKPRTLTVPIMNTNSFVEIFPDELPMGSSKDVIDLLKQELAPLEYWHEWAIEYYRQDKPEEFEEILTFVLENKTILAEELYQKREDEFKRLCIDIYTTLASKKLKEIDSVKDSDDTDQEFTKDCKRKMANYLKSAEEIAKSTDRVKAYFSFIIKAFYELSNGDFKSALSNFRSAMQYGEKTNNESIVHISRVGIACVLYQQKEYQAAHRELSTALERHPGCGAGVRIAIAVCCFHLRDYNTSKLALQRARELDPGNANIYTILALIELVEARNEDSKSSRDAHLTHSYEYSLLASSIDPNNVIAQNQVANNLLYSWKPYPRKCIVKNNSQLIIALADFELTANDVIKIGKNKQILSIAEVVVVRSTFDKRVQEFVGLFDSSVDGFVIATLSPKTPISKESMEQLQQENSNSLHQLWAKDLSGAIGILNEVLKMTSNNVIRSESYYILGKANHMRNQIAYAKQFYELSIRSNDEMVLAKFELAKLAFSQNDMRKALELCNQVLALYPTDKDTNALIYLINSITSETLYPIPQLTTTITGSQYEFDLWLRQAAIRQKDKGDNANALKCYQNAAQSASYCRRAVTIQISNNMIVLNYELGNMAIAYQLAKRTLLGANSHNNSGGYNAKFNNYEFDGIFFAWEELPFNVKAKYDSVTSNIEVNIDNGADSMNEEHDLTKFFRVGDEVVIGDKAFTIEQVVSKSRIVVKHRFRGIYVDSDGDADVSQSFSVKWKKNFSNFSDYTLITVFNLARVLENIGKTDAAFELYSRILDVHPTFNECYLRLSKICKDRGQNDKALKWLEKALQFGDGNPSTLEDIQACIGDLHFRNGKWEEAKRAYEKEHSSAKNKSRSMIGLGNIYFSNIASKAEHIKDSYKFYYHVANSDKSNIYASHGLAIVCAEKGHFDAANSMLSRLKEDVPSSNDVLSNLGNVLMKQGKYRDAESCYFSSIKSESNKLQADKLTQRYECSIFCLVMRGELAEALKLILSQVHLDPAGSCRAWFNMVIVLQRLSKASLKTIDVKAIDAAIHSMTFALKIVSFLNFEYTSLNCRKSFEREKLKQLKESCQDLQHKCSSELSRLQSKRDEKKKTFEDLKRSSVIGSQELALKPAATGFVMSNNTANKSIFGEDDDDEDDAQNILPILGDDEDVERELNASLATSGGGGSSQTEKDLDDIFAADDSDDGEISGGKRKIGDGEDGNAVGNGKDGDNTTTKKGRGIVDDDDENDIF